MLTENPKKLRAAWLDPSERLTPERAALLAALGWEVSGHSSISEVIEVAPGVDAVVVRALEDLDAAHELLGELSELGVSLIIRLPAKMMPQVVDLISAGVRHVLEAEDFTTKTWSALRATVFESRHGHEGANHHEAGKDNVTRRTASVSKGVSNFVFVDPMSRHLLALTKKVGAAEVNTLLAGPTGSGKEVIARIIHESSPRRDRPFVAINCAALPENLIEDMLFGHERGAFTGAQKEHVGLFEQADGGTLFLDEIGEMPATLQAKLLRAIQEKKITRLGGTSHISVNARIVAATNKNLNEAIRAGLFREDLYYRLATFQIKLISLKDRPQDIMPLAELFLLEADQQGKSWSWTSEAREKLLAHSWPGNVREVQNVMKRILILCENGLVEAGHIIFDEDGDVWGAVTLSESGDSAGASESQTGLPFSLPRQIISPADSGQLDYSVEGSLKAAVLMKEHKMIMSMIESCGSKEEAARKLGISSRTMRYKLARIKEISTGFNGIGMATT